MQQNGNMRQQNLNSRLDIMMRQLQQPLPSAVQQARFLQALTFIFWINLV